MTLQQATLYYVEKLILQFRDRPKARQTIAILTKQIVANFLANQLVVAFNIDTAVGAQLDVIGKYVGVTRYLDAPQTPDYFAFKNYDGSGGSVGFRDYDHTTNLTGVWRTYQDSQLPNTAIPDAAYRIVLKLQIILNHNDGTLASIQDYLHTFFPGLVTLVDNEDMTMDYTVAANPPLNIDILAQFLPKPMGVGITVTLAAASSNLVSSGGDQLVDSGGANFIAVS